jgi:hypothetical protein
MRERIKEFLPSEGGSKRNPPGLVKIVLEA